MNSTSDTIREPSALTCYKCGEPVMWVRCPEAGPDAWWLELDTGACPKCGSHQFNVRVDKPRCHVQIFGVNA